MFRTMAARPILLQVDSGVEPCCANVALCTAAALNSFVAVGIIATPREGRKKKRLQGGLPLHSLPLNTLIEQEQLQYTASFRHQALLANTILQNISAFLFPVPAVLERFSSERKENGTHSSPKKPLSSRIFLTHASCDLDNYPKLDRGKEYPMTQCNQTQRSMLSRTKASCHHHLVEAFGNAS